MSTLRSSDDSPLPKTNSDLVFPNPEDLSFLDVIPYSSPATDALEGLRITVIGGGPAGLIFARDTSRNGAKVTLIEKADDPRTNDTYTDRSFNITLESVGRYVLGDPAMWKGGSRLVGRAIHSKNKKDKYTQYGPDPNENLISIPRPVLRKNMVNAAANAGTKLLFNTEVTKIHPHTGEVRYLDSKQHDQRLEADLLVICDGLHSIGDRYIRAIPGAELYLKPEVLSCVSSLLRKDKGHDLSGNHIHFWHEDSGSYTIGIPNADGNTALLLASEYQDITADGRPFATPERAKERLTRDFPRLYAEAPELADQLQKQRVYKFYYKSVSHYVIGKRAVLVGDAACVVPPWAGFGANSAMYAAASLAYQLAHHKEDIAEGLKTYQAQQLVLSRLILTYVANQGEFLSGPVATVPESSAEQSLAPLVKLARQHSTTTEKVVANRTQQ